jgi:MscS family membrane protein
MNDIAPWIANFDPTTQLVVGALYYLAAAILLASVIDLLIKLGARYGINEDKRPILHFILKKIRVPLAWSVILLGINFTIAQLSLSPWLGNLVVQVSQTVTIIIWGQATYRIIRFTLKTHCASSTKIGFLKPQTLPLFDNLASIAMVMLGLYFIFLTWQIDMTAWLASAGVVGIAVGFAAKDTLANLFSGVFILADATMKSAIIS